MSQTPNPPAMHVAEIRKTYKGKRHVTTLVRRTFREDTILGPSFRLDLLQDHEQAANPARGH